MNTALRMCKKCGLIAYDINDLELFVRGTGYSYDRLLLCKKCHNEEDRRKREVQRLDKPKLDYLRKCRKCGLEAKDENDLNLFVPDNRSSYGRGTICKKCLSGLRRKYYATNPEYREKILIWHHEKCKKTKFRRKLIAGGKPILCYFCGKEITILTGRPHDDSLVIHSLDGNHQNWDDINKAPAHHNCHMSYSNIGHVRNSGENNHFLGKHHSEETRLKISKSNKGRIISEEWRNHIADSRRGKPLPEETKKKISDSHKGSKNHRFGKHCSEETKKRIIEGRKRGRILKTLAEIE